MSTVDENILDNVISHNENYNFSLAFFFFSNSQMAIQGFLLAHTTHKVLFPKTIQELFTLNKLKYTQNINK